MIDLDLALLSEDARSYDTSALADRLVRGVADLYATMYLAQAAHWNVTGLEFGQRDVQRSALVQEVLRFLDAPDDKPRPRRRDA